MLMLPADALWPLERQARVLGDLAAAAVGPDEVPRPDVYVVAASAGRATVHGDAVGVLAVRQVLGVEPHLGPAGLRACTSTGSMRSAACRSIVHGLGSS